MGSIVTGEFVCIRWLALNDDILRAIELADITLETVVALMADQHGIWGLSAGQTVTVSGSSVRERALPIEQLTQLTRIQARIDAAHAAAVEAWPRNPEDDEDAWERFPNPDDQLQLLSADERAMLEAASGWDRPIEASIALPPTIDSAEDWMGPGPGRWLILVQYASHCWAALRGVEPMIAGEVDFSWKRIVLPSVTEMLAARPSHQGRRFDLVYPPSPERPRQSRPGMVTEHGSPSLAVSDIDDLPVTPQYAAGMLNDGAMHWLDLPPGDYSATATPTTAVFRARLGLFRRELAARGIYYEDDASEQGYELGWAIEDGAIPTDFHEHEAVAVYSVSGEGRPEADKQTQAVEQFDPEDDRGLDFDWARECGAFRMPARIDVASTPLQFYTDEDLTAVSGVPVDDVWVKAHLSWAALAAGLDGRDPMQPSLTAAERAMVAGALSPPPILWNAVDAADRVQRAAYALATTYAPDPEKEARLAQLRGPLIEALLAQDGLRLVGDASNVGAEATVSMLPPQAPGPFPRRAPAVIDVAGGSMDDTRRATLAVEALAAVSDPLERQLVELIATQLKN